MPSSGTSGGHAGQLVEAADGSRVLTGTFTGAITFGSTTLTAAPGKNYGFLVKYRPDGTVAWAWQTDWEDATSVALAVDQNGNVYRAAGFAGNISFGTTVFSSAAGATDTYLVKFAPGGSVAWAKAGGATNNVYIRPGALTTDAAGNVYISGTFWGELSFGAGAAFELNSTAGFGGDIFLYKFAANGTPVWARKAGGDSFDAGYAIKADAAGNTYLTGSVTDDVSFGTITLGSPIPNAQPDVFVAKYDPQGQALWARRQSAAGQDAGYAIDVDGSGNVVIGGHMNSYMMAPTSILSSEGFVARYNAQGTQLWWRQFSSTPASGLPDVTVFGVAYDQRGGIYAVGNFEGGLVLGANTLNASKLLPFVARFDEQGNVRWADAPTALGAADEAGFYYVATDAAGNAYLTGGVQGTARFGPLVSAGTGTQSEATVAKLNAGGIISTARSGSAPLLLTLYPNPASEQATLVLPVGGGQLQLTDALGRTVRTQVLPVAAGRLDLPLTGLAPGLYHLRATLGNGQVAATHLTVR